MNTKPRLSVVMPNFNHGKYLATSLGGILSQSVPPHEVIVVDDASTDNSIEILTNFASKHRHLRFFRNEKNRGVVFSMNRGIELASGDYLFFPAADDEISPGLFEKSLDLLARHPNAALSCTGSLWHDVGSQMSWPMAMDLASFPTYLSPDELVRVGQHGKLLIVSASAIFRKEPLLRAGNFLEQMRWHCDWYATYVTAFRHGICYVPEPLSNFYLHSTSYYHSGRRGGEHKRVLEAILENLCKQEPELRARIRNSASLALFELPILKLVVEKHRFRQFLTPLMFRRCLKRGAEVRGRRYLPAPMARLAVRILYGRH